MEKYKEKPSYIGEQRHRFLREEASELWEEGKAHFFGLMLEKNSFQCMPPLHHDTVNTIYWQTRHDFRIKIKKERHI